MLGLIALKFKLCAGVGLDHFNKIVFDPSSPLSNFAGFPVIISVLKEERDDVEMV